MGEQGKIIIGDWLTRTCP